MKKTLLTLALGAAAVFSAAAQGEQSMEFGYCGDLYTGAGNGQKCIYSIAIEVPSGLAEACKGAKITAVNVGFGKGVNKGCEVFVTRELGATPLAKGETTTDNRLKAGAWNIIPLEEPVTLDGGPLYVGYTYKSTSTSDSPIAFDGEVQSYNPMGDFVSIATSVDDLWAEVYGFGGQFGNACVRAVISGENIPSDIAMASSISIPALIRPWQNFQFELGLTNFGSEPITSAEFTYKLGGSPWTSTTVNFDEPVLPGQRGYASITASNNQDGEVDLGATAKVTKVNGKDNALSEMTVETTFSPNSKLFERRMVLEEYTGLGCGFCPRGYYGIEEFAKVVTDGSFIAIGVHNYGSDPMMCTAYNSWVSKFIQGAPSGTVNRMADFNGFNPSLEDIAAAYPLVHGLCKEDVQIKAEFADDTKEKVKATATMKFAEDIAKGNYGLAYVITQDKIGPYNQSNYYAGGQYGAMGGFESMPAQVSLVYNDVARDIFNWSGDRNAVPTELVAGVEYTHEKEMSLSRCLTLDGASLDNVNVIVLLIDRATGEIANAAKCRIGGESQSSVSEVEAAAYTVRGLAGRIAVDGSYDSVAVYNVDGASVGTYAAGQPIEVASGLYIVSVKANGAEKAVKVIVK